MGRDCRSPETEPGAQPAWGMFGTAIGYHLRFVMADSDLRSSPAAGGIEYCQYAAALAAGLHPLVDER
jgi:hypothetical protein